MTITIHGTGPSNTVHTVRRTTDRAAPANAQSVDLAPWLDGPYTAGPKGVDFADVTVILAMSYPQDGRSIFIQQTLSGEAWAAMSIEARRGDFQMRFEAHITRLFNVETQHFALDFFRQACARADFDTTPTPWHQQALR